MMYEDGIGVEQDYVTAHMWFSLAASLPGAYHNAAVTRRNRIAEELSTRQLAEAQRLAREWDEAHPRD